MSTPRRVRTTLVGCGYWGKNLVRNFARLSDLRICCDASDRAHVRHASRWLRPVAVMPTVQRSAASLPYPRSRA
jgi:hypothetical protein